MFNKKLEVPTVKSGTSTPINSSVSTPSTIIDAEEITVTDTTQDTSHSAQSFVSSLKNSSLPSFSHPQPKDTNMSTSQANTPSNNLAMPKPVSKPVDSMMRRTPTPPNLPGNAPSSNGYSTRAVGSVDPSSEMRKLVVGQEITMSGEISSCDFLIVEGNVEAKVRDGHKVEITENGTLRGTAEIVEADIAGIFEGEMICSGRLRLRANGKIKGKIQYGELEIEAGGRVEGELSCLGTVATDNRYITTASSSSSASKLFSRSAGSSSSFSSNAGSGDVYDLSESAA